MTVMIGIDPHKASHTAVAIDNSECVLDELRNRGSVRRVLAAVFPGLVVQLQPDWMWFLWITPVDTGRVGIASQVAVASEQLAGESEPEDYIAELMKLIDLLNRENQPIVEGIRGGAGRPQFGRAPLSYLDATSTTSIVSSAGESAVRED